MSNKPSCVRCELRGNFNGLFTCNGCGQHFCAHHSVDHTNELRNRFEEIVNQFNLVKDSFNGYQERFSERDGKFEKELNEIKHQIDQYQKTSNYSEQELDQWLRQLNKLNIQFTKTHESPSFFVKLDRFLSSKEFRICLVVILAIISSFFINCAVTSKSFFSNLSFSDVDGPIRLSHHSQLAEHIGLDFTLGSVRVDKIDAEGIHRVRLSLEQISSSSKTFIGITSKSSSYGWYIGGKTVISQNPDEYQIVSIFRSFFSFSRYSSRRDVESGDILEIELDYTNSKITLTNQRTSEKYQLDIDLKQSPFPWQIILHLDRHGDRVRLLK